MARTLIDRVAANSGPATTAASSGTTRRRSTRQQAVPAPEIPPATRPRGRPRKRPAAEPAEPTPEQSAPEPTQPSSLVADAVDATTPPPREASTTVASSGTKSLEGRCRWLPKYELELGLRPIYATTYEDAVNGNPASTVIEASCKFCETFGREVPVQEATPVGQQLLAPRKRAKRTNVKRFKKFRRDNVLTHHRREHPIKFSAYEALPMTESSRKSFFRGVDLTENGLRPFFRPPEPSRGTLASTYRTTGLTAKGSLRVIVPRAIIEVVVRLLANPEERPDGGFTELGDVGSLEAFHELPSGDFELIIKDTKQFETVIRCVPVVPTFSAIATLFKIFEHAHSVTILGQPNEKTADRDILHMVALNLTAVRDILQSVWGFSLHVTGATHAAEGYLDVRLSFGLNRSIHSVHLLAIPVENLDATVPAYTDLVVNVLKKIGGDTILRKLLAVTSDGTATMLGCRQEFSSRIRAACEREGWPGVSVAWCGSHQLNAAVGSFISSLDDLVAFRSRLGSEISFTRSHDDVSARVGMCPPYTPTRWESIHETCHFLESNYSDLVALQDSKQRERSSASWWTSLFLFANVIERICRCLKAMQNATATMADQRDAISTLIHSLKVTFEGQTRPELTDVSASRVKQQLSVASWHSPRLFETVDEVEQERLVEGWRRASSDLINSVRGIANELENEAPNSAPETPKAVIQCDDATFTQLLQLYTSRLEAHSGSQICPQIWRQRNALKQRYAEDAAFSRQVDAADQLPVDQAWAAINGDRSVDHLMNFVLGLAARTPGASPDVDTRGDRSAVGYATMARQLQAAQYFLLIELATAVVI